MIARSHFARIALTAIRAITGHDKCDAELRWPAADTFHFITVFRLLPRHESLLRLIFLMISRRYSAAASLIVACYARQACHIFDAGHAKCRRHNFTFTWRLAAHAAIFRSLEAASTAATPDYARFSAATVSLYRVCRLMRPRFSR